MSAGPPTTLGKYQIIREIARSNDIVYEAYDPALNRRVAIKELNVPGGSTPQQREERVRRFQREIKAAGSLAHPGIVTIYEVGEDQGRFFMAMEYLDGKNLRNELDTNGLIPTERALEITIAILDALAFSHENGVIHRDIKPENIQISASGRIKLTDFGIARLTFEPNITIDGQVFGTPSYMSPEQVIGKEIDARSDLFSVGAVFYEMLTGSKAFPGDSVVSISYAIMNSEPAPPASLHGEVLRFLNGLLEKTVSIRTASAPAALSEAKRALESLKMGYLPPAPIAPPIQPNAGPAYPPQQPCQYGYNPGPQTPLTLPVPIYIPPPPRPPLFKPETKLAIARFLGIVVSLSLVLVVIVVAVQSMAGAADRIGSRRAASPSSTPLSPEDARRWSASADEQLARGQISEAVQSALNAAAADPSQPAYPAQLAQLYDRMARSEPDLDAAVGLWGQSATQWDVAAKLVPEDFVRQERFRTSAATAQFNGAIRLLNEGQTRRAREEAIKAKSFAPLNSEIARTINSTLDEIS